MPDEEPTIERSTCKKCGQSIHRYRTSTTTGKWLHDSKAPHKGAVA